MSMTGRPCDILAGWRRGVWPGLLLVALAGLAGGPAAAQPEDDLWNKRRLSHRPIPADIPHALSEPALRARLLGKLRDAQRAELEKLARDLLANPKKYGVEEALKRFKIEPRTLHRADGVDLDNPQMRQLIDEFFRRQQQGKGPEVKLSEPQLKQLREIYERLQGAAPPGTNPPPNPPGPPADLPPPDMDLGPGRPTPLPPTQPPTDPPESDPELEAERARTLERLRSWFGRLENTRGPWRDSPALRRAVRDLSRLGLSTNGPLPAAGNGDSLDARIARWSRSMRQANGWWKAGRDAFRHLDLPPLPEVDLSGWSGGGMPGFPAPSGSVPEPPSAQLWQVLLAVSAIAVLVLVLWKLRRWQAGSAADARAAWRLGPWPVDPARVATRAELVRAFEYLSLIRIGRPARCWNHRQIAAQLADSSSLRDAALELADLYEQARYAPEDEPLAGPALERARRHLCLLAGLA